MGRAQTRAFGYMGNRTLIEEEIKEDRACLSLLEGERLAVSTADFAAEELVDWQHKWRAAFALDWNAPDRMAGATLRARGYVGLVPFVGGHDLEIRPRIGPANLLEMVECTWDLRGILPGPRPVGSARVADLYEFLADRLAEGVLRLGREGLALGYSEDTQELAFIRGTPQWGRGEGELRRGVVCRFASPSADHASNRLFEAALSRVVGLDFRQKSTRAKVRKALKILKAHWPNGNRNPSQMQKEFDMPLAQYRHRPSYRLLHGLCRFILYSNSPSGKSGRDDAAPFLFYLPGLFERFVGHALHLLDGVRVKAQWRLPLHQDKNLAFIPDYILMRDKKAVAVVDSKYKWSAMPEESDIQQVAAYALKTGASTAFLVYPQQVENLRLDIGSVEVRTLGLPLAAGPKRAAIESKNSLAGCLGGRE